ncbi:MAG: hypothetical protein JWN70_7091 [Planctomycetaceae bacterium]|nr:hypothetical protein [Planctomycetaceae bacterium]
MESPDFERNTPPDMDDAEKNAENNMERTEYLCDLTNPNNLPMDYITATRFDPLNLPRAVESYRLIIARRGVARTYQERMELQAVAQAMRTAWKIWNGRDELHELAFGGVSDESSDSDTLPG